MKIYNDSLLLLHDAVSFSGQEFLLLCDINKSNLILPYWNYLKLKLESLENDECVSKFRFEKEDIYILGETLEIPESNVCYNGTKVETNLFIHSWKDLPIHADIRTWSVDSKHLRQNFVLTVIMSWTLCMNQ